MPTDRPGPEPTAEKSLTVEKRTTILPTWSDAMLLRYVADCWAADYPGSGAPIRLRAIADRLASADQPSVAEPR